MRTQQIQPILLVGMSPAVSSQILGIVQSFSNDSWKPEFLTEQDPIPDNALILVSCDRCVPTPGNYLRVLPVDSGKRALELTHLNQSIDESISEHPALVLVKRAKRSLDGTYSDKAATDFTNALRVVLKVPRTRRSYPPVGRPRRSRRGYNPYMGTDPYHMADMTETAL